MEGLVKEIQRDILDGKSILDILRKSLVLSKKLKLDEFTKIIDFELNGYTDEKYLPEYRKIKGYSVELLNPYHGWQIANFNNYETFKKVANTYIRESISVIESLSKCKEGGSRILPSEIMSQAFDFNTKYRVQIAQSEFQKIITILGNFILNKCLDLENAGIIGEGISFSKEEIQKASTINYIFHGSISDSQVGNSFAIQNNSGINIEELKKLLSIVKENIEQIESLPKGEEIIENFNQIGGEIEKSEIDFPKIQGILGATKEILSGASSSIVATGLMQLLGNINF